MNAKPLYPFQLIRNLTEKSIDLGAEITFVLNRVAGNAEPASQLLLNVSELLLSDIDNNITKATKAADFIVSFMEETGKAGDPKLSGEYMLVRCIASLTRPTQPAVNEIERIIAERLTEKDLTAHTAELKKMGYIAFASGIKVPAADQKFQDWIAEHSPAIDYNRLQPTIPGWDWIWWTGWNMAYLEAHAIDCSEDLDLFEDYDMQPDHLKAVFAKEEHADIINGDATYEGLKKLLADVEAIGFTFDYYLDGEPYDLRWIAG